MTKKKSGGRTLTPKEEEDWLKEAQFIAPLNARKKQVKAVKKPAQAKLYNQPVRADTPFSAGKLPTLSLGSYAGVDRNTREKFRKGEYPIDARLDLHGYTRDTAWRKIENFVHSQYEKGSRVLLIITGKGTFGKAPEEAPSGVLREALPGWLTEDGLRPFILAFDRATAKDGGSGAFYVLLKRRRD